MKKEVYFKTDGFVRATIQTDSEGSLFHYTKDIETLQKIIVSGFRYSYCFEEHSKRVSYFNNWKPIDEFRMAGNQEPQYGIAVPMICFCDIPILKANEHRAKYGTYCIGLNKGIVRKEPTINPLLYASSSWVYDTMEKLVEFLPTQKEIENYYKNLSSIRNTENSNESTQKLYQATKDIKYRTDFYSAVSMLVHLLKVYEGETGIFYNEHEWRAYFTDAGSPKYALTREEFDRGLETWNKQLWENEIYSHLKFENQDSIITYVIVENESDIPKIIKTIKETSTILGYPILDNSDYVKDILISKITSFERIESDY